MDNLGCGTVAEEVQKCITMVLVWVVDTLFNSVHACKLLWVAWCGDKSGYLVLTGIPTVL